MNEKLVTRGIPAAMAALSLTAALALAPPGAAAPEEPGQAARAAEPKVIVDGLDNPRQLTALRNGRLLVAEAGHGADDPTGCVGEGEEMQCIGLTGRVSVVDPGARKRRSVMGGLLSAAGPDGSFAVGADGASRLGATTYALITWGPPEMFPEGVPGDQSGMLLRKNPGKAIRPLADIAAYEIKHDVDGEGVETNPYSVLALNPDKVLVADAAGDYIAKVNRKGKVRVWAKMKEYGPAVDAVPTVLTEGPDRRVYVGELHSEIPGKARVWRYSRNGKALRSWKGFTTVTGVAVAKNGTMYVSELFGGDCGFDEIPTCFPGRVVKVKPNGKRSDVDVPFPAGVAVQGKKVYVAAFSVAPKTGMGGPGTSGQIWRIFR